MDFLELAKNRYTAKMYNPSRKVSEDQIEKLKEIIRLSPSSIDSQPWLFTFVTDEKTKEQLAEVSFHNKSKINNVGLVVVFSVLDDVEKFESLIEEILPAGSVEYYKTRVKPSGEAGVKAWMANQVYLSLGFFLSAAASLHLDTTPMEGIERDKYDQVLEQKGYKTLFAVAVGYRDKEDSNQPNLTPKSRLDMEKVVKSI